MCQPVLLDYWGDTTIPADDTGPCVLGSAELGICSLTVDLRARPLGPGVFVGGADGVSDRRERLKQKSEAGRDFQIRKRLLTMGAAPDKTSGLSVSLRNADAQHNRDFYLQESWAAEPSLFIFCAAALHHHITMHPRTVCSVCSTAGSQQPAGLVSFTAANSVAAVGGGVGGWGGAAQ